MQSSSGCNATSMHKWTIQHQLKEHKYPCNSGSICGRTCANWIVIAGHGGFVSLDWHGRAVGAGPAGPVAAGPIFCQLTRAKMLVGCSIVALKVAMKGPRMTAVIHKISVGAGEKHTLLPEESLR